MTRDARDGDARGRERGDDRDAGDTHDELAGEDAKLRAMRSVWLSMRDEEPSSGGLAELMAAARGKAAEMAPPPTWWQRAVAGLRRPQVLAFATVLVLLGGAMVVGRQVERDGAPVAARSESVRARPEVVSGAAPSAPPPAHGERMLEQTRAAPPATDDSIVQRAVQAAGEEKARTVASSDLPRTPPAVVAPSRPTPKPALNADLGGDVDSLTSAPAATTLKAGLGAGAAPPSEAADLARGEPAPPPQLAVPSPAAVAHDERKPDRAAPTVHAKPPERRAATPAGLYRQCEAAATRGDCVEVRRLVEQISTTDRQYRARAAKASPIAKCLAE